VPHANGETEEEREQEGGEAEETMEESGEERDSDLEDSEAEEDEEEEEESSEIDDEDCERRRMECLDEMSDLEKQFLELKEKLFRERLDQVKVKLDEVLTGKAGEYREPLAILQKNMQLRTQVAGVYRELCLQVIKHKHECEIQGAKQHLESERVLLFDTMKTELLEKIRRLEEDKQSVDITSGGRMPEECRRSVLVQIFRNKGDVQTCSNYRGIKLISHTMKLWERVVETRLREEVTICEQQYGFMPRKSTTDAIFALRMFKYRGVRCEGGTLFYEGERFSKGNTVLLEVNDESPAQAVITAVSAGEVWFKRTDGSKTKIYISQLQKGKYTISR
ncbi:breast cancer metastasis-suppressor 1-like protein-A isoform X1, partial [Silurus asotus]